MNQLSKQTVVGFLFLFLGAIELIGCGIVEGIHGNGSITGWLLLFAVAHLILGYGFFFARYLSMTIAKSAGQNEQDRV